MKQQKSEKNSQKYKVKWWQFLLLWVFFAGIAVMWDGEFTLPRWETYVVCDTLENPIATGKEKIDPTQNGFYCAGEFYVDVHEGVVYRTSSQKYQIYLAMKNGTNLDNIVNNSWNYSTPVHIPGED